MILRATIAGAALALAPLTPAVAADGAAVFADVCTACHGANGVGTPGLAPPLADPPLWDRLGERAPAFLSGVLISGFSGTLMSQGVGYYGLVMPSQRDLSDAELAAVASYVLGAIAGTGMQVTVDEIAAARAAAPGHKALMEMRGGGM